MVQLPDIAPQPTHRAPREKKRTRKDGLTLPSPLAPRKGSNNTSPGCNPGYFRPRVSAPEGPHLRAPIPCLPWLEIRFILLSRQKSPLRIPFVVQLPDIAPWPTHRAPREKRRTRKDGLTLPSPLAPRKGSNNTSPGCNPGYFRPRVSAPEGPHLRAPIPCLPWLEIRFILLSRQKSPLRIPFVVQLPDIAPWPTHRAPREKKRTRKDGLTLPSPLAPRRGATTLAPGATRGISAPGFRPRRGRTSALPFRAFRGWKSGSSCHPVRSPPSGFHSWFSFRTSPHGPHIEHRGKREGLGRTALPFPLPWLPARGATTLAPGATRGISAPGFRPRRGRTSALPFRAFRGWKSGSSCHPVRTPLWIQFRAKKWTRTGAPSGSHSSPLVSIRGCGNPP